MRRWRNYLGKGRYYLANLAPLTILRRQTQTNVFCTSAFVNQLGGYQSSNEGLELDSGQPWIWCLRQKGILPLRSLMVGLASTKKKRWGKYNECPRSIVGKIIIQPNDSIDGD